MRHLTFLVVAVLGIAWASAASAADTVRFRGPLADGAFAETGLLKAWPAEGPKLLWTATGIGSGFSSAVVAGDTVYVAGRDDAAGKGQLTALAADGTVKWRKAYGREFEAANPAPAGSRGTPCVDGDQIFVENGYGELITVNAKTGDVVRTLDLMKTFGAQPVRFGNAECPLVVGDNVICTPGGADASVVAINTKTGATAWQSKGLSDAASFCSATAFARGGKTIIATVTAGNLVGIDAANGTVLWKYNREGGRMAMQCNTPIYADGILYVTSGAGGAALEVSADGTAVKELWTDKTLTTQNGGAVIVGGTVYGTAGGRGGSSAVALELKTGKQVWKANAAAGAIVTADGLFFVNGADGAVHLFKAGAAGFEEAGKATIPGAAGGRAQTHPTIADGKLYVRQGDALYCYQIK